ncbi:restriction endonuclease, partial [Haemophilus influenzae]
DFYQLGEDTLWITFFGRKLYWAFCSKEVVEESDGSRTRKVISNNGNWSCVDANGKELLVDNLDGRVTKVQAYRGTICGVEMEDYLIRRINGEVIEEITEAKEAYETLIKSVEKLIKGLWWSDFELLTDLVFSKLGWQRYSVLGKTEKGIDLDLYSSSTQKRVFVQIKSDTDIKQLDEYVSNFESEYKNYGYSEMYYVYHSGLENIDEKQYQAKGIKLVNGRKMAELVISAGLVEWLINKRS